MKYVISDLHFNHENVIAMDQRPFLSVDEMNAALIHNWNHVVRPKDEVYLLGDVAMGNPEMVTPLLNQLNGHKFLIRGNHDAFLDQAGFDYGNFDWVGDLGSFKENHRQYVLSHYPILDYPGMWYHSRLLYGHVHSNQREYFLRTLNPNAVNVSASVVGYRPVNLAWIEATIADQWQQRWFQVVERVQKYCPLVAIPQFDQMTPAVIQTHLVSLVASIFQLKPDAVNASWLDVIPRPEFSKAMTNAYS